MQTKKAFNQLAYQLIYPAVLGSIIFDLADPFREMSEIRSVGFLIGLCFIVDYLHMTLNLCKDGASPHKYGAAVDIIIAFLFCLAYFSISRTTVPEFNVQELKEYLLYSLGFISAAQLIIIIYEMPMSSKFSLEWVDFIPLFISVCGWLALFFSPIDIGVHIIFISMLAILIAYTYRVVKASYKHNNEGEL